MRLDGSRLHIGESGARTMSELSHPDPVIGIFGKGGDDLKR